MNENDKRTQFSTINPTEEDFEHGARFRCKIDRGGSKHHGVICDEDERILWRYAPRPVSSGHSLQNPFGKPVFVVTDSQNKEIVVIQRTSFIPSVFDMIENSTQVGRINMCSILLNKYRIDFLDDRKWVFQMPLGSLHFWGAVDNIAQVWVKVGPTETEWNILIKPGVPSVPILFALAFIHNERWNYS